MNVNAKMKPYALHANLKMNFKTCPIRIHYGLKLEAPIHNVTAYRDVFFRDIK